jgi:hypothetical protein
MHPGNLVLAIDIGFVAQPDNNPRQATVIAISAFFITIPFY